MHFSGTTASLERFRILLKININTGSISEFLSVVADVVFRVGTEVLVVGPDADTVFEELEKDNKKKNKKVSVQ
jgi:hypothetical protein